MLALRFGVGINRIHRSLLMLSACFIFPKLFYERCHLQNTQQTILFHQVTERTALTNISMLKALSHLGEISTCPSMHSVQCIMCKVNAVTLVCSYALRYNAIIQVQPVLTKSSDTGPELVVLSVLENSSSSL